ncbi:hypothetical protein CWB96_18710 [Pseudoalteromonas citrea]|nr:hypothetical protein CWB96_18710 [Pseudoalteromonas citrea]
MAFLFSSTAFSKDLNVHISSKTINLKKTFSVNDTLSDIPVFLHTFHNDKGSTFSLTVNYKELPQNRSYPKNLDITLTDSQGQKIGYLFLATNGIKALSELGEFGFISNHNNELIDVRFSLTRTNKGSLSTRQLESERFIQDTLIPKVGFQMIRPVILPKVSEKKRSETFQLDHHPLAINYTAVDLPDGLLEFQHNLYETSNTSTSLISRIYFRANNLKTLRLVMYAGKYFSNEFGPIKLIFYPAMGQTHPPINNQ